ncbi:Neuronal pentraxin receptor [Papilio xuthus]|uniref:Neuronal pentraxin receptor n=1 Tax=Papilio xuthus TaxID=66420 RepID=A0A194PF93_PAPXU|nr:Neuronal pentraxin receptor [Papilio xuthus]
MRVFLLCLLLEIVWSRENDWQPIVPEPSQAYTSYANLADRSIDAGPQLKILNRRPIQTSHTTNKLTSFYNVASAPSTDTCSVYKVSMNQELLYQYLEYDKLLPDLKEFTLCMWTKFHNHSQDHPLFSYAVGDNPKEISSWISNTQEASYYSMAVHGQTFFRLNYPLKLNTWYHACQSWNGKTGEWQVWVNAERVGRGFHNRLVGHVIKGGGVAISGQEQSLLYKKDGLDPVIHQSGLMGEITMLQLYHVALTAGKAHKDHKHHHVHHFKHDGTPLDQPTEAATEPPPPQPTHIGNGNYLIGGQLQRAPNLNLAGAQQQMIPVQLPNGLQIHQQYVNGQLGNRVVSEQLLNGVQSPNGIVGAASQIPLVGLSISPLSQSPSYSPRQAQQSSAPTKTSTVLLSSSLLNPANVQYIDGPSSHKLFRRDSIKRDKRDNPEKALIEENTSGKKDKRGLVSLSDGSIVDEALLSPSIVDDSEDAVFERSLLQGLAGVVGNVPIQNLQKQNSDEREPAEAEVTAVMQVCSGCAQEPFKKALILSWRATPKKLYSGAHYYKGLPICRAF